MSASVVDATDQEREATPLELFFDLVFAFAVSQLSRHLFEHLSWRGAAETLVMLLAIFAVWSYTSWAASMVGIDSRQTNGMVLAVMPVGLFMNAAVTNAFSTSGWAFVVPFLSIQLGRTTWTLINTRDSLFREHFSRTLLWLLATSPLWLAGAAVDARARLLWWAAAAALDQIGAWLAHPIPGRRLESENVGFNGVHMLERCRLFLLIALGETVLTTGAAIAEVRMAALTLVTGTLALIGTGALWALCFGPSAESTSRHVEETSNPIRASHHAVNATMMMVAGLIAVAVANETVIAHPRGEPSVALSLLLCGGPILFLLAGGWYMWSVPRVSPRLHLAGSAALAPVAITTAIAPPYVGLVLVAAGLLLLAILDRRA